MSVVTSSSAPGVGRIRAQSSPIPSTARPRAGVCSRIQAIRPNSPGRGLFCCGPIDGTLRSQGHTPRKSLEIGSCPGPPADFSFSIFPSLETDVHPERQIGPLLGGDVMAEARSERGGLGGGTDAGGVADQSSAMVAGKSLDGGMAKLPVLVRRFGVPGHRSILDGRGKRMRGGPCLNRAVAYLTQGTPRSPASRCWGAERRGHRLLGSPSAHRLGTEVGHLKNVPSRTNRRGEDSSGSARPMRRFGLGHPGQNPYDPHNRFKTHFPNNRYKQQVDRTDSLTGRGPGSGRVCSWNCLTRDGTHHGRSTLRPSRGDSGTVAARDAGTRPAADRGVGERDRSSAESGPAPATRYHSSHGDLSQGRPGHAIDLSDEPAGTGGGGGGLGGLRRLSAASLH